MVITIVNGFPSYHNNPQWFFWLINMVNHGFIMMIIIIMVN
jgi:hypothetical protein